MTRDILDDMDDELKDLQAELIFLQKNWFASQVDPDEELEIEDAIEKMLDQIDHELESKQ